MKRYCERYLIRTCKPKNSIQKIRATVYKTTCLASQYTTAVLIGWNKALYVQS